jgi:hypothetical protein
LEALRGWGEFVGALAHFARYGVAALEALRGWGETHTKIRFMAQPCQPLREQLPMLGSTSPELHCNHGRIRPQLPDTHASIQNRSRALARSVNTHQLNCER